jgi:hypothetical protein
MYSRWLAWVWGATTGYLRARFTPPKLAETGGVKTPFTTELYNANKVE